MRARVPFGDAAVIHDFELEVGGAGERYLIDNHDGGAVFPGLPRGPPSVDLLRQDRTGNCLLAGSDEFGRRFAREHFPGRIGNDALHEITRRSRAIVSRSEMPHATRAFVSTLTT